MARKPKCRRICHLPVTTDFVPLQDVPLSSPIILTLDEYETIRLIDKEGLSQEQCSERMQVARTTTQKIYEIARKKLADALVDGLPLHIEGGSYRICDGRDRQCVADTCHKQELVRQYDRPKGESVMRIAVTYDNGEIFQHFGRTEFFKVYDVENGQIVADQVVGTNGSGHGALAEVLQVLKVDALICGGIGMGAQIALDDVGIELYGGVTGSADQAAAALAAGKLTFDPEAKCGHHDHHHGTGHVCGSHGCGEHSCGHH